MAKVCKSDGEGTFAGVRGNDQVAPFPVIPRPLMEPDCYSESRPLFRRYTPEVTCHLWYGREFVWEEARMNQGEFEADLQRNGYEVFYGGMSAGHVNPVHSHEWDARVMVIGGEITLSRGGKTETFRVGDSCSVAAGEMHTEHVGPQGVAYVAGRRTAK